MAIDVTYGGAAVAGLVSFLSPCVLPLVPPYLCYMAGVSLDQLTGTTEERVARQFVMLSALGFVLGFATVFVSLGAAASAIGQLIRSHLEVLSLADDDVSACCSIAFSADSLAQGSTECTGRAPRA